LLAQASSLAASLGADVAGLLADTIGELCRGQVLELQYLFDTERTEDSYLSAIEGKTATLMATACRVGGMVSNVSADTLDALTQFGQHLGMCFQIVDDVLDVTRTEAELGKPVGNDVLEGVYTLPVIYALQSTPADELTGLLGRKLERSDVARVVALVARPDVVDASMAVARTHATKATEALAGATGLDADVCARMRTLVNGLILRSS
jgi:geranylgeranyl pyrophosphate synthase